MTHLHYRDSEGILRQVKGVEITQDKKSGKYWVWSEALEHNLAYKIVTREDALVASISSLLSAIELKNKELEELREIYKLAEQLADRIKPDSEE